MGSTDSARKDAAPQGLGLVFAALALAVFAGAASMRILDALLPAVALQYGQSVGTASMAVTAYALSYSGSQVFYGPLGDRLGPFRVVYWTTLLSAGAALSCALAPSLSWLVVCRFIAGGIAAAIGPLALTLVGHATSNAERPLVLARMTSASILGMTVGQMNGGLLGQFFDWQAGFVFTALLFAGAAMILARIGARRPDVREIGRIVQGESGQGGRSCRLLRRPAVRTTLIWVGLEGLAGYMSLTYAAAMLQRQLEIGPAGAGVVVGFFGVGGIAFALFSRRFLRWWSSDLRAVLGGSLAAIGFGLAIVVQTPVSAAACMFCIGLGFFALHNILQVRATCIAPDAPSATVSLFAATFVLAQAVGAALGGWAFDFFGPSFSFVVSAAVFLGLGLSVSRGDKSAR